MGKPLTGEQLIDGGYAPIALSDNDDGLQCGYSPVLGLSLCAGNDRLLFHNPIKGEYLRTLREAEARVRDLEEELRRLRP